MLTTLSSLSHEDVGPTNRVELERQRRARLGSNVESDRGKRALDHYARMLRTSRIDVVVNKLRDFSRAFGDPQLRLWIAEHIVEINAAGEGRWPSRIPGRDGRWRR